MNQSNKMHHINWIENCLSRISLLSPQIGKHIIAKCGKTCKLQQSKRKLASDISEIHYNTSSIHELINEYAARNTNLLITKESDHKYSIQTSECKCQFVKEGLNHPLICNCSLGATKEIFELLLKNQFTWSLRNQF